MMCDTVGRVVGASARARSERSRHGPLRIYEKIINGPNGLRLRQGEKVVGLCRKVWRIMRRLHPELFYRKHPNPWDDFTLKSVISKCARKTARGQNRFGKGFSALSLAGVPGRF